jgi:hypothetical protein
MLRNMSNFWKWARIKSLPLSWHFRRISRDLCLSLSNSAEVSWEVHFRKFPVEFWTDLAKFLWPWETVKQCFRGIKHCVALLALLCHWQFICNNITSMGCLLISPVELGDLCDMRSFMSVLLVNLQQQVYKVFCWIILDFKLQTLMEALCESFCTHCLV